MSIFAKFTSVLFALSVSNFFPVSGQVDILDILDNLGFNNTEEIVSLLQDYDIGSFDIRQTCETIKKSTSTNLCERQMKIICENDSLLWTMFDAASKLPYPGMSVATRLDIGNYQECINIDHNEDGLRIIGKHCLGGFIIPTTSLNDSQFIDKAFKLSICIPDGCTATDLLGLFNISTDLQVINDQTCSTKESGTILDTGDIAALLFLIVVAAIVIISTMYDVYLHYMQQDSTNILFIAFSILTNGKKLLKISKGVSEQIKVIHGLRVISMTWIVAAHSYGIIKIPPLANAEDPDKFEYSRSSTYITTAYLAVDTFFFISGFLLAYLYLKQDTQPLNVQIKRIPLFYLHRYLRLTPPVAVLYFLVNTIFHHAGSGPLYKMSLDEVTKTCRKWWWSYFLYTQNYVNYNDLCIIPTWYLSTDWQLFLISPIVLIPVSVMVKRYYRWTILQLILLNIIFTAAPVGFKILYQDFDNDYDMHTRLNIYFIGVTLGVFMREKINSKYIFNATASFVIWIVAIFILLITLLALKETQLAMHFKNDRSYIIHSIFLRVSWSIGLSWIIYSCHNGHGGIINSFLSNSCFQILSKLTYCMYLTHIIPGIYLMITVKTQIYFHEFNAIQLFISTYIFTLILATIWTLAFEAPVITIVQFLLGTKRK